VSFVQGQTVSSQNFGFVQGPFSNAPYQPPINIATGSNPVSLAAGDFNNDGKADFVVANNAFPGQIFLGQGNGLFTQGTDFDMGAATRYMVARDLNNDGKLDLVVADQDNDGVGVLLGKGDGTFQNLVIYPAIVGTYGVAVADFNGDGKLDLVATGNETRFALLTGKGDGTFNAAQFTNTTFGGISIAAGDINKDGKQDVVLASQTDSSIVFHAGNGNGTFAAGVRMTAGVNQPSFVTLGDLNGDAKLDLVYLNEFSDQVAIQLGYGNGTFAAAQFFGTAADPRQVAILDVDLDGKLDLVVSCRSDGTTDISGGVSILRGNGDGTFQSQLVSTAHTSPTAVAIADFNGDAKLDIVAANFYSSDVSLLLNGINGPYGSIGGVVWNDANFNSVRDAGEALIANLTVFADVDNDGLLDPGERFTTTTTAGSYVLSGLVAGTYRIRVATTADFAQTAPVNGQPRTVTLTAGQNATGANLGMASTAQDGGIVFDNVSAKLTGAWPAQTTNAGFFGSNYLSDGSAAKGSKSVRFTTTLQFDGYYQVFVRWTAAADRATNVPIDINASTNTRTVLVNQQLNGGKWVAFGTYFFTRTGGSIVIRNAGTNGVVVADAIKLVAAPAPATVAVDNANAANVTVTGAWTASTAVSGYYGSNALEDGNPAVKGQHSVQFSPGKLAAAGLYEVFAWWTSSTNRATNARFDINTSTGVKTVLMNQRTRGGQWVSLGFFSLNAAGATVTVRNDNANGVVAADAVRYVRVA
jgi:hypothetical protein